MCYQAGSGFGSHHVLICRMTTSCPQMQVRLRPDPALPGMHNGTSTYETYISFSGVGFLDVGCGVPGTQLSKFSSSAMQGWSTGFYQRLSDHMQRASSSLRQA
jgi:hypothetical protein